MISTEQLNYLVEQYFQKLLDAESFDGNYEMDVKLAYRAGYRDAEIVGSGYKPQTPEKNDEDVSRFNAMMDEVKRIRSLPDEVYNPDDGGSNNDGKDVAGWC